MILVTGGAGFVGSHIVERLACRGEEVLAVDLYEPSEPVRALWKLYDRQIKFEQADIMDETSLASLFVRNQVERVVHAATITPTAEREWEEPGRILHIGIVGSAFVLTAALRYGVQRFVYLSSASIYEPVPNPACVLSEDDRQQQKGLYPLTKVAGEWLTRNFSATMGMESAAVRIAACYGPLERNTGARTTMSLVWNAVQRAMEGKPLLISSPDYALDYTYVRDIAEGITRILFTPNLKHDVYNISGGRCYTLLDLAEAVTAIIPGSEIVLTEQQTDGVLFAKQGSRYGRLDIGRLTSETGFEPAYHLKSGLADYTEWLAAHDY